MDSMRSLDTSLPGTSPPKSQISEPPEQLLNAFKAAALSVTKLYKTAAVDQGKSRAEGYQDALDNLLAFLDKEDIGLSDGEGWRIRRWATERLDGRETASHGVESDDEAAEKRDRTSTSPEIQRFHSSTRISPINGGSRTSSPARTESQAPATTITPNAIPTVIDPSSVMPPQGTFSFRSSHVYPQDADITLSNLDLSDSARTQNYEGPVLSHVSNPPITLTRSPRSNSRYNNHPGRLSSRSGNSLSRAAGQKRKINMADMADFFDISSSGHGKDGFGGGGKRGRFA